MIDIIVWNEVKKFANGLDNLWLLLILVMLIFSGLYLWFALFPGSISMKALDYFSYKQALQGRDYAKVIRTIYIVSFLIQIGVLLWLIYSKKLINILNWAQRTSNHNYWSSILLFFLGIWLILNLVQLPLNFFSGYVWQHQWGFSTQNFASWWMDYFKEAAMDFGVSAAGVLIFYLMLNRRPSSWWIIGAGLLSVWIIIQSFLWPVVIAPLFNKFQLEKDPAIITMVKELSQKSGIPVNQVLVMDASRRTTKANAYFAGLGGTKRVVLYDNLLKDYSESEIKAVLAHELAHWRQGHILKGVVLGIFGNFTMWALLYIFLNRLFSPTEIIKPYSWAYILMFFLCISFISSPIQNYVSRNMESEADRVGVMLTGDKQAAIELQRDLAVKNLSDVSPPAFIVWFSYTHPTAVTRIEQIKNLK